MDLEGVVREHRQALKPVAGAVREVAGFDLSIPCALVTEGVVVNTTLSGLRSHLSCSTALASAPVEQFVRLRERVGFDAAFEAMTADDEVGEEFVAAWDAAQDDLASGVVASLNDLAAFAEQAKQGWLAVPRRMLVVAREGLKVTSGTVPVDWVLAG
jgi:hypothetical protein